MKRYILSLIMVYIMFTNLRGQWEILNEGTKERLYIIDFVNDEVGWIAGEGRILKTEDGGETWNYLTSPIIGNRYFNRLDFVNDSVGWASVHYWDEVEERGYDFIIKSVDGGHSWFAVELPFLDTDLEFYSVSETVTYVVGTNGDSGLDYILKTVNGGKDWIDISISQPVNTEYHSVRFVNEQAGIVLGNRDPGDVFILNTIDGGNNWNKTILSDLDRVYDLQFIDISTAFFLAHENVDQSGDKWFLYESGDSGESWFIKTQFSNPIQSYYFLNCTTGFAIMGDVLDNDILKSTDGGLSWEKKQTLGGGRFKIYFNEADVGFVLVNVLDGSLLWRSVDKGDNWIETIFSYNLDDVYFFDKNSGIARGEWTIDCDHGCSGAEALLVTNDGGESWKHGFIMNDIPSSFYFVNDNLGFIRVQGSIYKTTDAGLNWTKVYDYNPDSTGYNFWGGAFNFLDENIGWVVGSAGWSDLFGAGILGTDDGGKNWGLIWKYPRTEEYSYRLHSIHSANTIAWTVGTSGMIVMYTEQDQWQPIIGVTDLPLRDVFFSDENHGWISGGYFDEDIVLLILLKTTDGGENWQEIPGFNYQINDIFFENNLHGWAVGNDTSIVGRSGLYKPIYSGIILETWDGGDNWTVQVGGLHAPLNAIHFKDGYGWAVGGNGLVLRTEDGSTWVAQNTGKTYQAEYTSTESKQANFRM